MVRKSNTFSVYRMECPICGEEYLMSELEYDDMTEMGEEFSCSGCGFTAEVDSWPSEDYTKARITIRDNNIIVEEE